jgi:hypothetical protein
LFNDFMVDLLDWVEVACAGLSVTRRGDARASRLLQSVGRIFPLLPECGTETGGQWFGFAIGKGGIGFLSQNCLYQPQLVHEAATIAAYEKVHPDSQPLAPGQATIQVITGVMFVQFAAAQHVPVSS